MLLGLLRKDNNDYQKGYDDGYHDYPVDKKYKDNKEYIKGYQDGRLDDDLDLEEDEY